MSSDPKLLYSFLHPSAYPGDSYWNIAATLTKLYFVPLTFFAFLILGARYLLGARPRVNLGVSLLVCAPLLFWLVLAYSAPFSKAGGNIFELSLLGILVGALVGFSGRILTTWHSSTLWAAVASLAAMGIWMSVPPLLI